jgi:hypothetical protein
MEGIENTGEFVKLSSKLKENQQEIADIYYKIGEEYYTKYVEDPLPELQEAVKNIAEKKEDIRSIVEKISALKGKRTCQSCGFENNLEAMYCIKCGQTLQHKE